MYVCLKNKRFETMFSPDDDDDVDARKVKMRSYFSIKKQQTVLCAQSCALNWWTAQQQDVQAITKSFSVQRITSWVGK